MSDTTSGCFLSLQCCGSNLAYPHSLPGYSGELQPAHPRTSILHGSFIHRLVACPRPLPTGCPSFEITHAVFLYFFDDDSNICSRGNNRFCSHSFDLFLRPCTPPMGISCQSWPGRYDIWPNNPRMGLIRHGRPASSGSFNVDSRQYDVFLCCHDYSQ